jgi:hypothetical protein
MAQAGYGPARRHRPNSRCRRLYAHRICVNRRPATRSDIGFALFQAVRSWDGPSYSTDSKASRRRVGAEEALVASRAYVSGHRQGAPASHRSARNAETKDHHRPGLRLRRGRQRICLQVRGRRIGCGQSILIAVFHDNAGLREGTICPSCRRRNRECLCPPVQPASLAMSQIEADIAADLVEVTLD